jgi:hypothetical protein
MINTKDKSNPTLEHKQKNLKQLFFYILSAYLLSIAVRLFLYYQISDNNNYFYDDKIIPLWTADAGLYGYYANQILSGVSYPFVSEYMPGYLLSWIVNLTGVSLDSVLFFSPAFISSLVVIPIILIANRYKMATFGLYSAFIGSIMTSYYYRTHLGYYDTDVLNVFLPLLIIYFLIKLVEDKNILDALYASLTFISFSLWYHSSSAIILSIIALYFLYILVLNRKETLFYQSLFLMLIALLPLVVTIKLTLLISLFVLFLYLPKSIQIDYKYYLLSILFGLVALSFIIDFSLYYEQVDNYINKSSLIELSTQEGAIKLKSTLNSVLEAKGISWQEMTKRISGTTLFFILALFGYIALLLKHRALLLTLPLALLAILSMVAGLRFTTYGVMIFAFGLVFGVHLIFNLLLVKWGEFSQKISQIASGFFLLLVMTFALNNIFDHNRYNLSPTLFNSTDDIQKLNELKSTLKKDDFIMTWWDYGWLLWYYTNANNTLIDNGKHQQDNFIVSKILLSDNQTFTKNASLFFVEKYYEGLGKGFYNVMDYFTQNYPINYLDTLKDENRKPPQSNRDIYIVLHKYMLNSLRTIESFSNLNIKTGRNYNSNFINMGYLHQKYNNSQKILETDNFKINLQKGEISSKAGNMKVKKISIVEEKKRKFEKRYIVSNGSNIVIYEGSVLLLKPKLYNSFLIQALVFNNYNRDYFEKISETNNFLILKIKK